MTETSPRSPPAAINPKPMPGLCQPLIDCPRPSRTTHAEPAILRMAQRIGVRSGGLSRTGCVGIRLKGAKRIRGCAQDAAPCAKGERRRAARRLKPACTRMTARTASHSDVVPDAFLLRKRRPPQLRRRATRKRQLAAIVGCQVRTVFVWLARPRCPTPKTSS